MSNDKADWLRLVVKFRGKCATCAKEIQTGEVAYWSKSSKAIKHIACQIPAAPAKNEDKAPQSQLSVLELDCFVCGKPVGCASCSFVAECDRTIVSQACICNACQAEADLFKNYKDAFLKKQQRIQKVKI